MINVNDLRNGVVYKEDNQLWQVVNYEHIKMGRGSGNIKVKIRNLKTGASSEKSFITGARVEEAGVEKKKAQFLYSDGEIYNFMDPESFEQFSVPKETVSEQAKFLKDGMDVILIVADETALGLEIPNTLIYEITDTGPGEKGNTVSNVYKDATLDNGLQVKVPMFMKVGDRVKVDTRNGQYIERVK
ncbi:MAG: elongation factor P [Candidatus Daviesbacteria bacterium]|nr:elongation factor P [Candidatus Daviesbacteria bacterium]